MEGFLSTFTPFSLAPGSSWGKREGRLLTPQGLNYLDLCRVLFSQNNRTVFPLFKKANTRECGVQVNAKVHKLIQCSLGPKTLFFQEEEGSMAPTFPQSTSVLHADGTPPVSHLRFLRPVSLYSPVFDRRLFIKKLDLGNESKLDDTQEKSMDSVDDLADDLDISLQLASKLSGVQFLEQRYGFFHCKKCNIRWESAYVWCISGTSKVYFKQLCRKCQVGFNPYRVESIICMGCSQTSCTCEKKQRHINMKRPHRQDLCCRCKGMKLSCDGTYSFKYIV